MIPLGVALNEARQSAFRRKNFHAPVRNTPYVIKYPVLTGTPTDFDFVENPKLLVPANQNRVSLVVTQLMSEPKANYAAFYSFGYPAVAPRAGLAGRLFGGVVVPGYCISPAVVIVHFGPPGNGTISEDDLYVTLCRAGPNQAGYSPGQVTAYEGVLAVESERNH